MKLLCICIETPHEMENIQTFEIFINIMFRIGAHDSSKFLQHLFFYRKTIKTLQLGCNDKLQGIKGRSCLLYSSDAADD